MTKCWNCSQTSGSCHITAQMMALFSCSHMILQKDDTSSFLPAFPLLFLPPAALIFIVCLLLLTHFHAGFTHLCFSSSLYFLSQGFPQSFWAPTNKNKISCFHFFFIYLFCCLFLYQQLQTLFVDAFQD